MDRDTKYRGTLAATHRTYLAGKRSTLAAHDSTRVVMVAASKQVRAAAPRMLAARRLSSAVAAAEVGEH